MVIGSIGSPLDAATHCEDLPEYFHYDVRGQAVLLGPVAALPEQFGFPGGIEYRRSGRALGEPGAGAEFGATMQQGNQLPLEFVDMLARLT